MSKPTLYGYHGKILEADLTKGTVRTLPLDPEMAAAYLGGRGLATRLFFDQADPGCDPLGPGNVMVLATSLLVGTRAPTSCRGHMVFKSPLTGFIGSSNCGGSWARVFKSAGYDVLLIKGKAAEPVMLDISPEKAEIVPAKKLWGLDVHETTDSLMQGGSSSKKPRVLCIGPAGENLVRFAAVMTDRDRAYGRSGPGAMLGSKNLKAVRAAGREKIEIADRDKYNSGLEQARYLIKAVPTTKRLLRDMGTSGLIRLIDLIEMLPHKNFQDNLHEEEKLMNCSGEALRDNILERAGSCSQCPLACQRHTRLGNRKGEGPEYETIAMSGPNCDIYDLEKITLGNYTCNEQGMDTISFGGTVACAMELFEKGALTAEDTGGLELSFSNGALLEKLALLTSRREGIGDRLAEGSARLAAGCGMPELAMTVKGLEIPGYDPRSSWTQALGYVTSPTGACHLRGGYAVSLAFFGGAKEIPRFSMLQSPIAIRNMQNIGIIQDTLGICRFTGYALGAEPWSRMVSGTTGLDLSTERLEETADRIATLERIFNVRAGAAVKHDKLPERFGTETIEVEGMPRMVAEETLEKMLGDYYELQGWDAHGVPLQSTVKKLKIGKV